MRSKLNLLTAVLLLGGLGQAAQAAHIPDPGHTRLVEVGPLPVNDPATPQNEANGFPLFYTDVNGLSLELCLDPAFCLLEQPAPADPISFPDNFGPEAFWQSAEIVGLPLADGGSCSWRGDLEAAFANEEPGDQQVAFGRIRIRCDIETPGTYRITHPYGRIITGPAIVADPAEICGPEMFPDVPAGIRTINETHDLGNFLTPGGGLDGAAFAEALGSGVGPFLEAVDPPPPAGFIGNPFLVDGQTVKNSPCGTNVFMVERLPVGAADIPANWITLGETSNFSLAGKKITVADGPIARDDTAKMENIPPFFPIPVLANDIPRSGTAIDPASMDIEVPPLVGEAVDNPDGTATYTPAGVGIHTFQYSVKDNTAPPLVPLQSNLATVTVTVLEPEVPKAGNDTATTAEDTATTIPVLANDTDNIAINPATVQIVINGAHGAAVANPDGTVTYTPAPDFNGSDSFTYTVMDFNLGVSNAATVTVTVTSVPDPAPPQPAPLPQQQSQPTDDLIIRKAVCRERRGICVVQGKVKPAKTAKGTLVEIHNGSCDGTLLGTAKVKRFGSWKKTFGISGFPAQICGKSKGGDQEIKPVTFR